jgi:hypothetical protein
LRERGEVELGKERRNFFSVKGETMRLEKERILGERRSHDSVKPLRKGGSDD